MQYTQRTSHDTLIAVQDLTVYYRAAEPYINNLQISVRPNEKLALVGSSGAGKSSVARVLAGDIKVLPHRYNNVRRRRAALRTARYAAFGVLSDVRPPVPSASPHPPHPVARLPRALIFQNSHATLNPLAPVYAQLKESVATDRSISAAECDRRARALWCEVGLDSSLIGRRAYPHQFSGGMCQRAVIAISLAPQPALIIADEPTKSLDGRSEDLIIDLLNRVVTRHHNALLLITHDVLLAHRICERVVVMERGSIVDHYRVVKNRPGSVHPITTALWRASVQLGSGSAPRSTPSERGAPLLILKRVSYHYQRNVPLLHAIDLTIGTGECVGLQGITGSGKSTLLALIAQLKHPDAGSIVFQGREISAADKGYRRSVRRAIQIIFQDPLSAMNPHKKIMDIISEPLQIRGARTPQAQDHYSSATHRVMHRVGLSERYASKYPRQLSGGEQQRVLIARALVQKPLLILADEPLSTLDTIHQCKILALFRELQEQFQISFFIVSHHIERLQRACHRRYILKNGTVQPLD